MNRNSKSDAKSTGFLLKSRLGRRTRERLARTPAGEFRRLSPRELKRIGLSTTSERYILKNQKHLKRSSPTISKRQYAQKQLSEQAGRKVTLEERGREYLRGERQASTTSQARMRAIAVDAASIRRKYRGETVKRIREHLHNIELKERGDYLDPDVYLREKAFAEAHLEVPGERKYYQKWFNYGHVKRTSKSSSVV